MIELGLDFNGNGGPHLSGDGLIVSTPTGRPAYNVSAGGPIVHPSCDAFVITPLAVHSLAFRPIIASPDEPIAITVARVNDGTTLVIDGQLTRRLKTGDRVHVRRGGHRVRMIRDPRAEFWSTVVRKMRWATGPTYRDR
jgi:NAD+ kinase